MDINEQKTLKVTQLSQYVKKIGFEAIKGGYSLSKIPDAKPKIDVKIGSGWVHLEENVYEVIIQVTINSKLEEKEDEIFRLQMEYSGIYSFEKQIPKETLEEALMVNCTTLLFPYVRSEVSRIIMEAGYPSVMLAPIDFRTVYYQQKNQSQNTKIM